MSKELWKSGPRILVGSESRCCLCLAAASDDPRGLEGFESIESDSNVHHDERRHSYARILAACFRMRTSAAGPSPKLLCQDCRAILKRTWIFFVRVKNAQAILAEAQEKRIDRLKIVDSIKRRTRKKEQGDQIDFGRLESEDLNFKEGGKSSVKRKPTPGAPYRLDWNQLACNLCEEKFPAHKLLVGHMSVHYPNYVCDACGKTFATNEQIYRHRYYAHSNESLKCDLCAKSFKARQYLANHLKHVHGDPAARLKCPECPQRFKAHRRRVYHMIEAHGEEPLKYECKLCPKKFKLSNRLTEHVNRFHLKRKRHACAACPARFVSKNELDCHALKHTGAKDFECERCGKRFGRKYTLVEHAKSHDNVRNHVCAVCDKAFVQKCTLVEHMKVHEKRNG